MNPDRSLYYFLVRGALGVGIVAGALGLLLNLVKLSASTLDYDDARAVQGVSVPQKQLTTIPGTRANFTGDVHFSIDHAPFLLKLEAVLPSLVLFTAMIAIALLLFLVVLKLQRGAGLTASSVRSVRTVVVIIATAAIVRVVLRFIADRAVVAHASTPAGHVTEYPYHSPLWFNAVPALIVAAVLLLVAEAFHQGQGYAEEVEGLV